MFFGKKKKEEQPQPQLVSAMYDSTLRMMQTALAASNGTKTPEEIVNGMFPSGMLPESDREKLLDALKAQ